LHLAEEKRCTKLNGKVTHKGGAERRIVHSLLH